MEWKDFIDKERDKEYYLKLKELVDQEYNHYLCHPDYKKIYHAFSATPLNKVKVVILGQDPYHEVNQAHGLAFSVLCSKIPPSLVNIYKEMETDLGVEVRQDGNLDYLAKQGVLLLNTILTVRDGKALAHQGFGWEIFTDNVIRFLNTLNQPIVFILWGSNAISKKSLLNNPNHLILTSPHPSPLSAYRGFFGSRPFSKTNDFLMKHNLEPICWVKA
ncbi:MAG: uracil-DNA glycosylase [Anaeroplasmataceae bacterium]|nr:uracil-DNA glycosylase [Anaeroplasmataceae bacterium]